MAKIDVGKILAKAASGPESKPSKTKTPAISLENHTKAIEAWIKANADLKDAEAKKLEAESEFLPDAEAARIGECRRDGKFYSSVKVGDKIVVSVQNRYAPISPRDHGALEKTYGGKTEDYFKTKTDISLTDAALNDETILQKLIAAIGEDKFTQYFDVKQSIVPTEQFHEARALNAEVGAKASSLIEMGILKAYKPAVKGA
jgi:hypothetical protein